MFIQEDKGENARSECALEYS